MTIHQKLQAANVPLDHHESDLYALVNTESIAIVRGYEFHRAVTSFRSPIDGKLWFDIPFAYDPFWIKRSA